MRSEATTQVPDAAGRFGAFGGRYVPETLVRALDELAIEYEKAQQDAVFQSELADLLRNYVGRPSPLYFAKRLTEQCGGAQIWLKREDLNHTGAHKINNTIGQALLTLRMKKQRVIAETGAGQHGVATATACAHFGLTCVVYMGEEDIRRQAPNVISMKMLGAEVRPVTSGSRTLRDAINEAMRDWMSSVETTHYILGSVVGPHPFPRIVRDFQSVIGRETIEQCREQAGAIARSGRRLRRRRQQRGRHVLSVCRTHGRRTGRRRSRRPQRAAGRSRGPAQLRPAGRAARQLQLRDARRRRPNLRRALPLGRARLPRRRAGAQLLERQRPREIHQRERQRSPGRLRRTGPQRRNSAGPGKLARRCQGDGAGPRQAEGTCDCRVSVRPRRQGRGGDCEIEIPRRSDRKINWLKRPSRFPSHRPRRTARQVERKLSQNLQPQFVETMLRNAKHACARVIALLLSHCSQNVYFLLGKPKRVFRCAACRCGFSGVI